MLQPLPRRRCRDRVALAALLTLVATASRAQASGFGSARLGAEHGSAADASPAAIYYNPAGLSLLDGQQLVLEVSLALRSASYTRAADAIDESTLDAVEAAGLSRQEAIDALSGETTLGHVVVLPSAAVASDLGVPSSPLRLGAAFFVPFGGQSVWDEQAPNDTFPGAVDGSARWYHIEGTIRSMAAALGGAYRIDSARLAFGVAGNLYFSEVSTVHAVNANGTDNLVSADGSLHEGRSFLAASGVHLGLGAGVLWEPVQDVLWIGGSYQSQPGFGTMRLTGKLRNTFGSAQPSPPVDVVFTEELPDIVRLGARVRPSPAVELRVGADWTRWSRLHQMCLVDADVGDPDLACATRTDGSLEHPEYASDVLQIFPRSWHDAFGVRAGGSYFLGGDVLELFAGAAFDGNAVPDSTLDSALIDMNKLTFALGTTYRVQSHVALRLTLTEVLYLQRDTRGTVGNEALALPSRQPANAGLYRQNTVLVEPALLLSF